MTVQDLIDELMKIEDKTKFIEWDEYYIVSTVKENKTKVTLY